MKQYRKQLKQGNPIPVKNEHGKIRYRIRKQEETETQKLLREFKRNEGTDSL